MGLRPQDLHGRQSISAKKVLDTGLLSGLANRGPGKLPQRMKLKLNMTKRGLAMHNNRKRVLITIVIVLENQQNYV